MRQYTTPTLELKVVGQKIADEDIYVTVKYHDGEMTFQKPIITATEDEKDTTIAVPFTQEQTALFNVGENVSIQVNWMSGDTRCATNIAYVRVTENLLKETLP